MKQTAVEWLFEQISSSKYYYKIMEDINSRNTVAQSNIFEQAKEMEKKQIINACNQTDFEDINGMGIHETITKGEQYYNETFKSE
jgi:hypothetical protein